MSFYGNSHVTANCVVKHWHICRISEKDCLSLQAIKQDNDRNRDASLTALFVSVCELSDVLRMQISMNIFSKQAMLLKIFID